MHRAAARCQENFYPRPPRGGRRPPSRIWRWSWSFLSTPSARRATRIQTYFGGYYYISIHALREEGDAPFPGPGCSRSSNFYPRPPRGGRRISLSRRSTARNFYPRPPRGGRRHGDAARLLAAFISIHALREEGDRGMRRGSPDLRNFYPRPPRGGRLSHFGFVNLVENFYPRPPRGGRPMMTTMYQHRIQFLSTPSARRATQRQEERLTALEFLSTPSARRAT